MRIRIRPPPTYRHSPGLRQYPCCLLQSEAQSAAREREDQLKIPREAGRLTCLAEQTRVAWLAVALQRLVACAVLAARHRGTLAAAASCPAYAAATLSRRLAVAARAVAATAAAG